MLNGECIIDGWYKINLGLGENFTLRTAGSDLALTNLKLKV